MVSDKYWHTLVWNSIWLKDRVCLTHNFQIKAFVGGNVNVVGVEFIFSVTMLRGSFFEKKKRCFSKVSFTFKYKQKFPPHPFTAAFNHCRTSLPTLQWKNETDPLLFCSGKVKCSPDRLIADECRCFFWWVVHTDRFVKHYNVLT